MGKKGDMLRWAKAQQASYTFTRQQLEDHDAMVRKAAIERKKADLKEYAHAVIEEDFNERNKLLMGDEADILAKVFCLCISTSARVLVRDFKWTPIGEDHRCAENMRLSRFATAVKNELEEIVNNELLDIRRYSEKVYDETGLYFQLDEEEKDAES